MALTPSQQAAVAYDRHLILFAGPGSGKTATSVAKGERILRSADAHLGMVTFTTAGAGEMRDRMAASFARRSETLPKHRLVTGTFHSLTLRHYQRHGRSTKKLIAPPARAAMLNGMLAHLDFDKRSDYILTLDRYQGAIQPETLDIKAEVQDFISAYLDRLRAINATDLATVMRDCTLGMRAGEVPLLPLTHLIGDEMQDADQVQLEFMLIHARAGVITTLVSDDDQTIYEWRSALGYEGLMHFARETGAKTITLAENFRSRAEIVAHAQAVIRHNNPDRIDKNPKAVRGPGGVLGYAPASHLERECENIASTIFKHRLPGESLAILGRSNRDLDMMEQYLLGHKDGDVSAPIAYQRDGESIWKTFEIATFLCLLQALLKGQTTDLVPVIGLLELDAKTRPGLETTLGPICGEFLDGSIPELPNAAKADVAILTRFADATCSWRRMLRDGQITFALQDASSEIRTLLKGQRKARPKQIDGLIDAAVSVLLRLDGPLSRRLSTIARLQSTPDDTDAVRLMTMHSSKGLEFDTVFLLNASAPDDGSTLMDDHPERRLFYVAMTRAKNRLLVSYSDKPTKYILESGMPRFPSLADILLDKPAGQ